jgi:hypothetical protein
MLAAEKNHFSGPVTIFHGQRLPETATPAGYAALIDAWSLKVPLPRLLTAIGDRHRTIEQDGWRILTPRHAPQPTLEGHLTFALKNEGLDLAVLKRLFQATGSTPIEHLVREKPTGKYARRIWFLYEWLTNTQLKLDKITTGSYVPALDPTQQYGTKGVNSPRHRVRDNLPGTPNFCPLVTRTRTLESFIAAELPPRAKKLVADVPKDLLTRTAAFLLLKDSKSSFAIEGENPPQKRILRWGKAISEAGRNAIDEEELLRLQHIVIGDTRFVQIGPRVEGGFVGEHDRIMHTPIPDHISARPEDLSSLINGMMEFDRGPSTELDPVIAAAILAFGFVYVHPFEDGNGRIHRYLIHHVLTKRELNPPGVVFPISSAILDRIDDYRIVLEDYSKRLLPLIEWEPTAAGDVRVLNETADFYRFFDATPQAEFLYACVESTINNDLPNEVDFLQRYDRFCAAVESIVDMPNRTVDLLFNFLQQNKGKFSKRAREKEFSALTDLEVSQIEGFYEDELGDARVTSHV